MKIYRLLPLYFNCEKHAFSNKITVSYFLTKMLFGYGQKVT